MSQLYLSNYSYEKSPRKLAVKCEESIWAREPNESVLVL